jgi:hypothetical protein
MYPIDRSVHHYLVRLYNVHDTVSVSIHRNTPQLLTIEEQDFGNSFKRDYTCNAYRKRLKK